MTFVWSGTVIRPRKPIYIVNRISREMVTVLRSGFLVRRYPVGFPRIEIGC